MKEQRPRNWRPGRDRSDRARKLVFDVLCDVASNDSYANLVLPKALRRANFSKQDAAYATNLCYGTLRLQGRWDAIISLCTSGRNLESLDPEVLILLRMGAHQLLEFETPAHAAIYETVTLARNELGSGASGFVNAVLRRVSEANLLQWRERVRDALGGSYSSLEFLAAWFSHPVWIVRAYTKALLADGRSAKDLLSVLQANNKAPEVALVARDISVADLAADASRGKMRTRPGELVDSALVLEDGDPHRVFAVQDKLAGVQDEGSQLVARIVANTPLLGRDERWLDMCAGPGGKTATLAALAGLRGAQIYANEVHEHRLDLVEEAVAPWSDIVALRLGDGRDIGADEPESYDRVLIDAPCTGIGSLRRRPESRWRKEAGDALDLQRLQLELIASGLQALRPGGLLVYSTCSPHLVETREVVTAALAAHSELKLVDLNGVSNVQSKVKLHATDGILQLWPDLHQSDAMFVAVFEKGSVQ